MQGMQGSAACNNIYTFYFIVIIQNYETSLTFVFFYYLHQLREENNRAKTRLPAYSLTRATKFHNSHWYSKFLIVEV